MANDAEVIDLMNRLSRAEARVKELEDLIASVAHWHSARDIHGSALVQEARAILARAKEGEKR